MGPPNARLVRNKAWFAAAWMTMAVAIAQATEPPPRLVVPRHSGLRPVDVQQLHGLSARFQGDAKVSGTLVAYWNDMERHADDSPVVELVLDGRSQRHLPHFSGYPYAKIQIRNPSAAVAATFGAERAQQLLGRRLGRIEATGAFVISDLSTSVDCDTGWAEATVVSARIPDPRLAARLEPIDGC